MSNFPFTEKKIGESLIRKFSESVDSSELVWHRDRQNRVVRVLNGVNWKIQIENNLPENLIPGKSYFIPKGGYHRILKGKSNLVVEILESDDSCFSSLISELSDQSLKSEEDLLIPPPPELNYRIAELEIIQNQYHNRYNPESIQDTLDDVVDPFNAVLTSAGIRSQKDLLSQFVIEVIPAIHFHKNFFNAPRPHELARDHGIIFTSDYLDSAQSPSYPSGHTTQAYYIAHKLSSIYPDLKKSFFEVANMIAQSRIDRGVHFPSDNKAGILLAKKILSLTESKNMKITKRKLRRIIRESILNEDYGDPIGSGDPVSEILQWAEEGGRVRVAGKNIWPGMGNRSGLHSYADEMIRKKWDKSGDRFTKKVEALPAGTEVEPQRYKNINRDRGKWVTAGTVTIVNSPAPAQGPQPSKKVRKRMNDILQFVFGNSERIVSVSLYTGSDNPFGRGKLWIGTDTDGDTYLFQDDPSATEFVRTEKDDEGYWDYLGY